MANLTDTTNDWPEGVYQLETNDPVVGGIPNPSTGAGMSNIPHLQLAQRTNWLKATVDALLGTVASFVPMARLINTSGLATGGGDLTANRTITVPKATTAEAVAGTDDTKALTPLTGKALLGSATPTSRLINTSGLATGGGNLTADRTITVPKATITDARNGSDDTKALTAFAAANAALYRLPRWRVTYDTTPTRTSPAQIVSAHPGVYGDIVSRGSILNSFRGGTGSGGSYLLEMTINASSPYTLNQYLAFVDDSVYGYLNGVQQFSLASGTTEYGQVSWPLAAGNNLLQLVVNDSSGGGSGIALIGDLFLSGVTSFVPM